MSAEPVAREIADCGLLMVLGGWGVNNAPRLGFLDAGPLPKTPTISRFSARARSCCHVWQEKSGIAARFRQQTTRRLVQPDEVANCCGKLARGGSRR
jgi:hypothetical protein